VRAISNFRKLAIDIAITLGGARFVVPGFENR